MLIESRKFIVCRGLPGSGKTTWAKEFVHKEGSDKWIRVNRDDIRNMVGDYWIPDREGLINDMERHYMEEAMNSGYNIISDNMNLNHHTLSKLHTIVKDHNSKIPSIGNDNTVYYTYEIEIKNFFISLDECIKRDSLRTHPIGAKTIKELYHKYRHVFNIEQNSRPVLKQNKLLPNAIIVDLDGTLALNTSNRPYYGDGADSRYIEDSLNNEVKDLVDIVIDSKRYGDRIKIFIMTGREDTEEGRRTTENWLFNNLVRYDALYMRPKGDYRPDEEVKLDLFNTYIKDKYFINFVVDDRDKVVKMWRNLGLLCLQPWDGKF